MIKRAHVAVWVCDTCQAKWSYGGHNSVVADDKAKRDGWVIRTAYPLDVAVTTHKCPPCVRLGMAA